MRYYINTAQHRKQNTHTHARYILYTITYRKGSHTNKCIWGNPSEPYLYRDTQNSCLTCNRTSWWAQHAFLYTHILFIYTQEPYLQLKCTQGPQLNSWLIDTVNIWLWLNIGMLGNVWRNIPFLGKHTRIISFGFSFSSNPFCFHTQILFCFVFFNKWRQW